MSKEKYRSLSVYLKEEFKEKVFKVTLDGGFSCPNKDGTVSSLAIDPYAGCTYCEVETIRPLVTTDGKPIDKQLSDGIEKVAARHKAKKFIAYFQINSNTHAKPEKLRALYKEALSDERVALLAVSTRPDCINEEIVELLKEVSGDRGLWVELGL
ncbi:MAG: TIGR01212 family radical SAM protein, partial [Deltaproteobacteria bacterium]|nr:TIGR01212 family radical SAM protein [Deltaproteobacteria bacterium]